MRDGLETGGLPPSAQSAVCEMMEPVARVIENTLPALGGEDTRFVEQAQQVLVALRAPGPDFAALKPLLVNFAHRLSFTAED